MKQSEMATKNIQGMSWLKIGYGNAQINTLMAKKMISLVFVDEV